MHTPLRSFALVAGLSAALVVTTGCGQETAEPGAGAPTTAGPTTDVAAPTTDAPTITEESPTSEEPTASEEPAEEGEAWTTRGSLVGVYDDVAVVHDGQPGGSDGLLVALDADGSTVWERQLTEVPETLAEATDLAVTVLHGHRNPRLVWSGTVDGTTLAAAAVLDPATGADLATGDVELPDGYAVAEQVSGDQLFLAHATGVEHLLTVAQDGTMTVDDGSDGLAMPADSLLVTHDLFVDRVDGMVAVLTPDGPVGAYVDCSSVQAAGGVTDLSGPPPLSADRDHLWMGYAVVDLAAGSVTCVAAPPGVEDGFTAVADDGTLAGVDADGSVVLLEDGQLVPPDVPVEGHPVGFLGDLLVLSTDDGLAAHPLD